MRRQPADGNARLLGNRDMIARIGSAWACLRLILDLVIARHAASFRTSVCRFPLFVDRTVHISWKKRSFHDMRDDSLSRWVMQFWHIQWSDLSWRNAVAGFSTSAANQAGFLEVCQRFRIMGGGYSRREKDVFGEVNSFGDRRAEPHASRWCGGSSYAIKSFQQLGGQIRKRFEPAHATTCSNIRRQRIPVDTFGRCRRYRGKFLQARCQP